MKLLKTPVATLIALTLAGTCLPTAWAQEAKPAAASEHQVTRVEAQALLSRVSQEVWHAQLSSTGYGRVQSEYLAGERAFFKGDYAKAVKHLNTARGIVKDIPNDLAND